MLDVLPPALVVTAAVTRAFARELRAPVAAPQLASTALAVAVTDFLTGWSAALDDLALSADDRSSALLESAAEYVRVDDLLVPRALR